MSVDQNNVHSSLPRLYWIDNPHDDVGRVHMHNILAKSRVQHIAVVGKDPIHECKGNIARANTLSHIRAIRRIAKDKPHGQIAYVAENDMSYSYVPYWSYTLEKVLANAPPDWGILQLAYQCTPTTRALAEQRCSNKHATLNPFFVERSVVDSLQAPFVPWCDVRTSGTTFYAIHPRGYNDIIKHVKRYKEDILYDTEKLPCFNPNRSADHLYELTRTYTLHVPMFCKRITPQLACCTTLTNASHRQKMDSLVKQWYEKYKKFCKYKKMQRF